MREDTHSINRKVNNIYSLITILIFIVGIGASFTIANTSAPPAETITTMYGAGIPTFVTIVTKANTNPNIFLNNIKLANNVTGHGGQVYLLPNDSNVQDGVVVLNSNHYWYLGTWIIFIIGTFISIALGFEWHLLRDRGE